MAYAHINRVKKMIGVTGTYHDDALTGYAEEVVEFLVASGVDRTTAESENAIGVVARGVSDLWNLGSGNAALSPYFKERAIQLAYKKEVTGGENE